MCGRYSLYSDPPTLQRRFKFTGDLRIEPRYNIAPTQYILTVTNNGERRGELMRWGLIPFWAKDMKVSHKMINARAETAATSGAFKHAFKRRRCLIPTDGFFEWRKEGGMRFPNYIFLKSRQPFAFAGLWEAWISPKGEQICSCTILTTKPNSLMEPIHNRMPVILDQESEALWLDPMTDNLDTLKRLLIPLPQEHMDFHETSSLVNFPKNEGSEIIQPLVT